MVRWGSGSKPPRNKPLIYRRAASRGILTHPGVPLRRNTSIYRSGGDHPSAIAVTIRARMMATRRRERASEDEPAKSNNGRTGADPGEAKQTTPPNGSLH
ncbi:conserved hypothetical protein [Trichinella spiralis]|uniref:hypothetical protein n=1 Tax=Trichinella spiralis TaxID=6334 RepID=UPI0001EFB7AD|nr:conserved hypothetical protein [Trichinella spiralis]